MRLYQCYHGFETCVKQTMGSAPRMSLISPAQMTIGQAHTCWRQFLTTFNVPLIGLI